MTEHRKAPRSPEAGKLCDRMQAERLARLILAERHSIEEPTAEEVAFAVKRVLSDVPGARCVAGVADFASLPPAHQARARHYRERCFYVAH